MTRCPREAGRCRARAVAGFVVVLLAAAAMAASPAEAMPLKRAHASSGAASSQTSVRRTTKASAPRGRFRFLQGLRQRVGRALHRWLNPRPTYALERMVQSGRISSHDARAVRDTLRAGGVDTRQLDALLVQPKPGLRERLLQRFGQID